MTADRRPSAVLAYRPSVTDVPVRHSPPEPASPWAFTFDPPAHIPVGHELTVMLERIVKAALDMVNGRTGALILLDEHEVVEEFAQAGEEKLIDAVGRPGTELGPLAEVLRQAAPWFVTDLAAEHAVGTLLGIPVRSVVTAPVHRRGEVVGHIVLLDRLDDRPFDDDDVEMLQPLSAAAVASVENSLLYGEMLRRERWLEASNDVTTTVLSGAPQDEVIRLIGRQVESCTPANGVALMLLDSENRMVVEFATGEASELVSGMVADESWRSVSEAVMSGEPVVIDDLGATGRSDHPVFRSLGPCMLLPMRAADRTIGAIAVANYRDGRRFDPVDVAMAQAFAAQTALASVLSEARDERERLSVFEERDRIARDLHDLVIQRLFAAGMMLHGAARHERLPEAVVDRVNRVVDELDATVREIRQTIFALNQPLDGGLASSLRARILREVANAQPALGFQPHLRIEGAVDSLVPESVATHLVAALREALANVARHADARTVEVLTKMVGDEVVLEVVDDGVGVGSGADRRSGLRNLALRAAGLGGWCSTEAVDPDGSGTRLTWRARIR